MALDPKSITSYLPAQPLLSPELVRDLIQTGISDELCRASFAVGNQLQLCVDLSHAYSQSASKSAGSIEPLTDAWRRLANACFVLEYMIEYAIESAGADRFKPSGVMFGPLLRQIGVGFHPCVDDQGVICLPGWADRRQASRTKHVSIPAFIEKSGKRHPVEISDISSLGIGLAGPTSLGVGEGFVLRVGKSAGMRCTVRWSEDNRSGALFDTPLHRIDLEAILSTVGSDDEFTLDNGRRTSRQAPLNAEPNRETSLMDFIETTEVLEAWVKW